jgi:hypothetical protein
MGGIDHRDWLVGKYAAGVSGKRWYWALFTRMVDRALVTARLPYRQVHGTDELDFLDLKFPQLCPVSKCTRRKQAGRPLSSPSSRVRVKPDVTFDGAGHVIVKRRKGVLLGAKKTRFSVLKSITFRNFTNAPQNIYIHYLYSVIIHTVLKGPITKRCRRNLISSRVKYTLLHYSPRLAFYWKVHTCNCEVANTSIYSFRKD